MTFKITFSHRERYLGTLLQVEGMLKTWFPHIAAQKSSLEGSRHQINKVRISKLRNNQEMDCVWRNVFLFPFSLSFCWWWWFWGFLFFSGKGMPNFVHSCTFYI